MKQITFNTRQVRALLDGRMTATRRAVKPPALYNIVEDEKGQCVGSQHEDENSVYCYPTVDDCPYQPGDILYVQETWATHYTADSDGNLVYCYKADGIDLKSECLPGEHNTWHLSIHMPKEAERLFLRVTDVRVDRLQNMTAADTLAEGFDPNHICPYEHQILVSTYKGGYSCMCWTAGDCHNPERWCDRSVAELFGITVWNSTIKKADLPRYGWAANPWVWVIEFARISKEEAYGTTK